MGFYFRKSKKFGPFRLNFSKSGIGASFGVKGARVSSGPSGTYVHVGTNGFYYKQKINNSRPTAERGFSTLFGNSSSSSNVDGTECSTSEITTDITSRELLDQINLKINRESPVRLIAVICITCVLVALCFLLNLLAKTTQVGISLAPESIDVLSFVTVIVILLLGSLISWFFYIQYNRTRSTNLVYELQGTTLNRYTAVKKACETLSKSASLWRLPTFANDSSQPLDIVLEQPPFIKTNVDVWTLDSNRISIYFLPDWIFIWQNKMYSAVSYDSVNIAFSTNTYVSTGFVPRDSTIVSTVFQHVRKDGLPDLRYKYNPSFPVVQYAVVDITSRSGLKFRVQASNVAAANLFADMFNKEVLNKSGSSKTKEKGSNSASSGHSGWSYKQYERTNESRQTNSDQSSRESRPASATSIDTELKSAYQTLEIEIGATRDQVVSAYRELVRSYHPDTVASQSPRIAKLAEEKMKEINAAYEVLKKRGHV